MRTDTARIQDLLEARLRQLVNHPDEIKITPKERGGTVVLDVHVDPSDMGKVIGRGGRRAQAIRTVMKAQATRLRRRVIVNIVDQAG